MAVGDVGQPFSGFIIRRQSDHEETVIIGRVFFAAISLHDVGRDRLCRSTQLAATFEKLELGQLQAQPMALDPERMRPLIHLQAPVGHGWLLGAGGWLLGTRD